MESQIVTKTSHSLTHERANKLPDRRPKTLFVSPDPTTRLSAIKTAIGSTTRRTTPLRDPHQTRKFSLT